MKIKVAIIAFVALAAGCQSVPSTAYHPPALVVPVAQSVEEVKAKVEAVDIAVDVSRARVAANLINAEKANSGNPEGPSKAIVDNEVFLGLKNNGNVDPDPVELLAGETRARERAEGKVADAVKSSQESAARADAANAAKTKADQERDAALTAQAAIVDGIAKQVAADNLRHDAEQAELARNHKADIAAMQAKLDAKDLGYITKILGGIGGLCILGAIGIGVASIYSPLGFNMHNIMICGLLVLSSAGCFGMVRFLSNPWIPYLVGGICTTLVGVAFALWLHNWIKQGHAISTEREAAQVTSDKLDAVTSTAAHIVDQVELYAKKFPDATKQLFSDMGTVMDANEKKIVDQLKTMRPSKT